jgi:hypothetical protein
VGNTVVVVVALDVVVEVLLVMIVIAKLALRMFDFPNLSL